MRAAVVRDGVIAIEEHPTPTPQADRVLVRVASAGVNRADLLQKMGAYPAPPGWPEDVPGLEFAGTIEATGESVTKLNVGDAVMGVVGGGAHASHLLTPEALCSPVPEGLSLADAGAVPEAFVTAHDALRAARTRPGDRVLVHGVGSGVGTAAVQIAKTMGARTVGTSRTPEKLARCKELGLDKGVVASPRMADDIGEVDVVIDLIGGDYLKNDVAVCATRGRIVCVGLLAGSSAELDMQAAMQKRLEIFGTVLRARPNAEKAIVARAFEREVLPFFADGTLKPVIEARFPLEKIDDAYDTLGSNQSFGKVLLEPQD